MKFQRIIEAIYRQPLDITMGGFEAIDALVRPHLLGKAAALRDEDFEPGKTDLMGVPLPPILEVDAATGIATVNVHGPLIQHASLMELSCGACSYQDVARALDEASESDLARKVLLDIASPGGEHCGMIEMAEKIAELADGDKEIYAFTDSLMASAAYGLAAGCNGILCTPSSYVGSIGSMIAFLDLSKAYEDAGIKPVVFVSGKYKGIGLEGTSLTEEQSAYIMEMTLAAAGSFKDHVRAHRTVNEDAMEGQIMSGEDAEAAGLVDYVVRSIDEVEEFLMSGRVES